MTWNMTWLQMNDLETLIYETKAMLEVVSDGLLNDTCPSNPEDSGTVLRMAVEKIEKINAIHQEMWDAQREARFGDDTADDGDNEDDDGGENFDTKELFSEEDNWLARDIKKIQEYEPEDGWVFSEEREKAGKPTGSFDVKEIMRHEDGSATYQVSGSDEEMKRLFETFFVHALINGIKHTQGDNDKEIAKLKSLETARELEVLLREWETSDEFDYAPVVRDKRLKLRELLDKVGV